jgi:hypothetical protein
MRLFTIAQEFETLRKMIEEEEFDNETGELIDNSEAIALLFEEISGNLSFKLDISAYILNELAAGAEALKAEAKRLNDRASNILKNAQNLKNLMQFALEKSGAKKVKTEKFTFSFRKSERVEIDKLFTVEDMDRRFIRIKREFDLTKIKSAIKYGETVAGASIIEVQNFQIK